MVSKCEKVINTFPGLAGSDWGAERDFLHLIIQAMNNKKKNLFWSFQDHPSSSAYRNGASAIENMDNIEINWDFTTDLN